jgi:hypothetical protein
MRSSSTTRLESRPAGLEVVTRRASPDLSRNLSKVSSTLGLIKPSTPAGARPSQMTATAGKTR